MNPGKGIAIVGLGGCFPDAETAETFWENICKGHVAIGEVPAERWDSKLWYAADRSAPDRTYSRIGGFIRYKRFDKKRFRIPPRTLEQVDEIQKLALTAVADALHNAGLEVFPNSGEGRPFNRDRTAVIMGNAMGGENEDRTSLRIWVPEIRAAMAASAKNASLSPEVEELLLQNFEERFHKDLPTINEDSMPGELSNCITGRITNCFDLRGPNFTTDAACAASMAAIQAGVRGLENNEFDVALVGGADRSMDPPTYVKFAKIGALSGEMSAPFDERASGFVMGEGVGIVVLKRLEDAMRDGDNILALIRGVGAASDGKGKGITAPNPRGQRLAVERAYEQAGVPIETVGLFEAHGTSTTVGDACELGVLTDLLRESGAQPSAVPIGSVKSMIGHLKSAAGAASIIKTALALHNKILPPSANFKKAPASSPLSEGYLAVNTTARPWAAPADGGPRRAGISAFGFGGTNFHIVLEEWTGKNDLGTRTSGGGNNAIDAGAMAAKNVAANAVPAMQASTPHTETAAMAPPTEQLSEEIITLFADKTGYDRADLELDHQMESDLGIDTVKQAEIMGIVRQRYTLPKDDAFKLSDTPTLRHVIDYVARMVGGASMSSTSVMADATPAARTDMPGGKAEVLVFGGDTTPALVESATAMLSQSTSLVTALEGRKSASQQAVRLSFLADDVESARAKVQDAGKKRAKMLAAQGIFLNEGTRLGETGKIAFLFPGQGSQYLGMLKDLADAYPVVADTFREADNICKDLLGDTLTHIIWAERTEANDLRLRETQNCQPAMLAADVAFLRLMEAHGVSPALVAGHSLGEYAAAVAAGVMSFADAIYAVSARGREMAGVKVEDNGKMAVVAGDADKVESILKQMDGYLIAANKNCHTQTVIAGESDAVVKAVEHFGTLGIDAKCIPVSHAFHSRIVAPATVPLERVLRNLDIKAPKLPISTNVDASYYPQDRESIVKLMARQLASPVEFIAQLEKMYADGARIFIECGPRRAITGFVRNVLGDRDHRALAANHHKKPGVEGFKELLAALATDGVDIRWNQSSKVHVKGVSVAQAANSDEQASTAWRAPAVSMPSAASMPTLNDTIVVSGIAVALPSSEPTGSVNDDLFGRLLSGENFISPLSDHERQQILDRNVIRLDKAGGDFTALREPGEVIQLAARMGDLDLAEAYGIDAGLADALDDTGKLAIAAGIDALRDAGLPLVRRYRTTSTGTKLPDRWALPEALAPRTGVILGSAFPGIDRLIDEVSRHAAANAARRSASTLEQFVDEWAGKLKDKSEAKALRDAYEAQAKALRDEAALYTFSRKWLFRTLALGHAQLAQTILAQGPNTQINAACASGTQGMGIALDWLRLDRCDRVVVVSADNVTSKTNLPWFAAGFLAAGAATIEGELERAAVPFGAGRNGMILGTGAAAFVMERDAGTAARGITPIADVIAANFANSAFHGTRLNTGFISGFMEDVAKEMEASTGYDRQTLAKRTFFMSHETYTPARGGSAAAEVEALRHTFGEGVRHLTVANTKGYTGHPMGASIEDAVALKGLQRQTLPAVANLNDVDPAFKDLRFARGGKIDAELAMRFGAGFGSQVALAVYRRRATQEARLHDADKYARWIGEMAGRPGAKLEIVQRTLRVAEKGGSEVWELGVSSLRKEEQGARVGSASAASAHASVEAKPAAAAQSIDEILTQITQLFAEHTGYDVSDLTPEHALEADLGIDTVKQAEIFGIVREKYGFARDDNFKLSEVQSLRAIAEYVASRPGIASVKAAPAPAPVAQAPASVPQPVARTTPAPTAATVGSPLVMVDRDAIVRELTQLFADHTGYDAADLHADHQLESDLGIDTVKQAEIFGLVRAKFHIPKDENFKLTEVQTLTAIADYVLAQGQAGAQEKHIPAPGEAADGGLPVSAALNTTMAAASASVASAPSAGELRRQGAAGVVVSAPAVPTASRASHGMDKDTIVRELTQLFADHTGYDSADLHADHQLESDLGIDTVKQAEIFGLVRAKFSIPKDESFKLSEVQTLTAIAEYVLSQGQDSTQEKHIPAPGEAADGGLPITATSDHSAEELRRQSAAGVMAAVSTPVAASASHGMDKESIVRELTALFAEHTGYEASDLHPDHELESDLGIDTVKQAEIFGLVRAKFGIAKDERFKLTEVQTLTAIANYVLSQNSGAATTATSEASSSQAEAVNAPVVSEPASQPTSTLTMAAAPVSAPTPGRPASGLNRDTIVRELTALFAEHTGYDPDDLHPEHQLESDLGIDTVKQAEIFGLVRAKFGIPKDENFKLSDVQTLVAIADYVLSTQTTPPEPPHGGARAPAVSASQSVPAAQPSRGAEQASTHGFTARRVALVPANVGVDAVRSLKGQGVALVASSETARKALKEELAEAGAEIRSPSKAHRSDLEAWLKGNDKPADAIVYAVPELKGDDAAVLEATVAEVFSIARAFARARGSDMKNAGFLIVGNNGGAYGFAEQSNQAFCMGALSGVAKSLAKEWPEATVRIVDVDGSSEWPETAQLAVKAWTTEAPVELSWRNKTWSTLRRRAAVTPKLKPLQQDAVVVATGAARGVTFELVKALATRGALKIAVISRTAGTAPEDSPLTNRSDAEQKAVAKEALTEAGERVTPAATKRWIERERVKLEIHTNMESLRALGSQVEFIACEVGNSEALSRAMANVRWKYGSVDLLLHGAGIEESKFIADKDLDAFTRTFAPKASAALRLWTALRPHRMVTMGSVSGRFGNAGQVDYSAANEMMAAMARASSRSVLNLGWTAWGDIGMAVRGSVRKVLEAGGVELLPADIGIALGADLLTSDLGGDLVVAGKLGAFDASEAADVQQAPESAALPSLFSRQINLDDGGIALIRRVDPSRDKGLDDHRIDGVPVLPGVLGVEFMTQAAAHVLGEPVTVLRNVRFESPLKLFKDLAVDVHVEARRDGDTVQLALTSFFKGPGGKQMRRAHFAAQAARGDTLDTEEAPDRMEMASDPHIGRADVYRRYFHGPTFQVLSAVLSLGDNGANARPEGSRPGWLENVGHADFMSNPMLREAGFQTAGLWEMAEIGRMALPAGIDALRVVSQPAPGTPLVIEARRRGSEPTGSSFDVWVRGTDGTVYDFMQGYRTIKLRDLEGDERFEPASRTRTRRAVPTTLIVTIEEVQRLTHDDLNAALERYLSPAERSRYNALKIDKRRVEWLAARIAAKRLIRETWFGREGAIVPYNAISIQRDALGAPEVEIVGEHEAVPRISISHSDGVAAAFMCQADTRPGIDVERIESRDASFTDNYFTARERKKFKSAREPDRLITETWAVKEAMLKALGIGARIDFRDVEALSHATGWTVTLKGEAESRCQELGCGEAQVEVETRGERVIARVLLPINGAMQPMDEDSQRSEARS